MGVDSVEAEIELFLLVLLRIEITSILVRHPGRSEIEEYPHGANDQIGDFLTSFFHVVPLSGGTSLYRTLLPDPVRTPGPVQPKKFGRWRKN